MSVQPADNDVPADLDLADSHAEVEIDAAAHSAEDATHDAAARLHRPSLPRTSPTAAAWIGLCHQPAPTSDRHAVDAAISRCMRHA